MYIKGCQQWQPVLFILSGSFFVQTGSIGVTSGIIVFKLYLKNMINTSISIDFHI